ncbi:hypothetical protein [Planctomicrobium piriforme]|uniref:Uncharacterized protein n=1 Tax=Planctomicrobium piriforme TaxID=1576369 RepID=A0A1I3L109_9PLAN|nr:hypothetical protein [Planctomicrobium piriforme]SFI78387.1 hypothetical protein SAMN05421753_112105 [Planctomicrobium piriforme]
MIAVVAKQDADGVLVFTFVPKGDPGHRQFVASVVLGSQELDWTNSPDQPEGLKEEIEAEIRERLSERSRWIERVEALATQIETWARLDDWSTRRIQFRMKDAVIGNHTLPAVLMQKETCKVILEPVARSSPRAEGIVDLYLLPEYDDIASIYFYGGDWHLHYMFKESPTVNTIRDAERVDLTPENFEKILSEMQQNANPV